MNRVVVTGLGFISSIGNDRAAVLESLREGRCGIEIMPELAAANDRVKLAGTVKGFTFPTADPLDWTFPAHVQFSRSQLRTLVPNAVFASVSMDEAIRDAQLDPALVSSPQTGLYCASAGSSWMTHVALDSVLTRGPDRRHRHAELASSQSHRQVCHQRRVRRLQQRLRLLRARLGQRLRFDPHGPAENHVRRRRGGLPSVQHPALRLAACPQFTKRSCISSKTL